MHAPTLPSFAERSENLNGTDVVFVLDCVNCSHSRFRRDADENIQSRHSWWHPTPPVSDFMHDVTCPDGHAGVVTVNNGDAKLRYHVGSSLQLSVIFYSILGHYTGHRTRCIDIFKAHNYFSLKLRNLCSDTDEDKRKKRSTDSNKR